MLAEQSLDTAKAEREGASSRLTTARATHTMASIRRDEEVATQESAVAVAQARLTTDVRLQEQILVQAERALDLARADLAAVEAKSAANISVLTAVIPQVEATLAEARVRLSYATITAPIGGVVGTVTTQVGETVAAGFNAPIFVTLIDLDRLQVDAFVDEVDIGKVRTGQKAIFTVDSYPSEEFTGTVTAIYPRAVIQDNVVYYDVVISLDEPHGDRLRPEMTTSVTILLDERKDVLAIPTAAVRRESGKNFVRVPDEARPDAPPQTREVKLGWRDGGWVEVTNGLQEGEIVLLPEGTVQGNGR
jgi:RND family efflux transporter MFP subunit